MSPAIEKLADSVIGGLKNQPMILALLVFNLMVLGLVYFGTVGSRQKEERLMTLLLGQQSESIKLLAACSPTPR
jgi:hypothetical protein